MNDDVGHTSSSSSSSSSSPSSSSIKWWQKGPIYHIYPKSFCDALGTGTGNLKGILSKVDYLSSLGVSAVWLSPIYCSPMVDNGYDISDYTAIDPTFGTIEDFKELVRALHSKDIRLIMDFVPNHTSEEHPWFVKSVNRQDPFTDYYVWHPVTSSAPSHEVTDGKGDCSQNVELSDKPPNNWVRKKLRIATRS